VLACRRLADAESVGRCRDGARSDGGPQDLGLPLRGLLAGERTEQLRQLQPVQPEVDQRSRWRRDFLVLLGGILIVLLAVLLVTKVLPPRHWSCVDLRQ